MPTSSIRVLVLGNSGSGKSTYAARRAAQAGVELLELDTIVWGLPRPKDDPLPIGVPRPIERVHADLAAFLARHPAWVIEGCDGDLVERALPACTELVFLNPGVEVCLANNRARPWEPHKFDRAEEQEQMLPALLEWVEAYTTRTDPKSYARVLVVDMGREGSASKGRQHLRANRPPPALGKGRGDHCRGRRAAGRTRVEGRKEGRGVSRCGSMLFLHRPRARACRPKERRRQVRGELSPGPRMLVER